MKTADTKHEDIKNRVQMCYSMIDKCEKTLEDIRELECHHPKTEFVNYMWAPGHICPNAEVCSYCGKVIIKAL